MSADNRLIIATILIALVLVILVGTAIRRASQHFQNIADLHADLDGAGDDWRALHSQPTAKKDRRDHV